MGDAAGQSLLCMPEQVKTLVLVTGAFLRNSECSSCGVPPVLMQAVGQMFRNR